MDYGEMVTVPAGFLKDNRTMEWKHWLETELRNLEAAEKAKETIYFIKVHDTAGVGFERETTQTIEAFGLTTYYHQGIIVVSW